MITGKYNALKYVVYSDGEMVYEAGNSRHDSQVFVPAAEGVGLSLMRHFCSDTARDIARERNEKYGGVSYGKQGELR